MSGAASQLISGVKEGWSDRGWRSNECVERIANEEGEVQENKRQ